jgi:hypothetical protein
MGFLPVILMGSNHCVIYYSIIYILYYVEGRRLNGLKLKKKGLKGVVIRSTGDKVENPGKRIYLIKNDRSVNISR